MGASEPPAPRVVRVFVSSTFRDMQAERDELVKRVFPQIRRLCEQRGVVWGEVDLRWGVTDEQKAEGDVLGICLDEIDRTRPFFIGLLGQRYGWVPDAIPAALAERMGWLTADLGRSVTELEILHGVLNDPDAAGHASFYLRDPGWLDTVGADDRAIYVEDTSAGRDALEALRQRIRTSGLPARDFHDPVELGNRVLADLTAMVEDLYPDPSPPDPAERDNADHEAYAQARTVGFVERPAITALLDAHADGAGPPLVLSAEAGAGSTAAVAWWARARRDLGPVVQHYVGANPASADWRALVRRVVGELARIGGREAPGADSFGDDVALRSALAQALSASAALRPIVVLDGVDRLDDESGAPDLTWLPRTMPAGIRLVVTTSGGRPMEAAQQRGWVASGVPPLTATERRALMVNFLARYAKGLDEVHLARLVAAEQTGNPLFLRTVLDELRQHGDHFTLGAVIERLLGAATVDDLFELLLVRYEQDFERDRPNLVADFFGALWAAHRGISEAELRDLLTTIPDEPLPRAVLSPLYLATVAHLVDRNGLVGFANHHLRTAVEDRYLADPAAQQAVHARLAGYFAMQPLGDRVVDELAWQQIAARDGAGLVHTLGDLDFFEMAYRRAPYDTRRWWARATEAGARVPDVYRAVLDDPAANDVSDATGPRRQLVWGVARLLADLGYPDDSLRLNEYLVAAAREHPEASTEAPGTGDGGLRAALVNQGAALWLRGDAERAEAPLTEAVDRCRRAGDQAMLSVALGNLAMVTRDLDRIDLAMALSAEEESICRARDDLAGLQACLGNRAELLRRTGQLDAALALMVEQERICRDLADRPGIARAQAAQSVVLMDRGDIATALDLSAAHVATARELGDVRGLVEGLVNQVNMHAARGDLVSAAAAASEAETQARRLDDATLLSRVLGGRAQILANGGDWAGAERVGREAELTARQVDDWSVVAAALGIIGTARREQGDLAGCETAHTEELRVATQSGNPLLVAAANTNLGTAAIAAGRYPDALARYGAAEPVLRDTSSHSLLVPMLANRAQVRQATGDMAGAAADYASAAESSQLLGLSDQAKQWGEAGIGIAYQLGNVVLAEHLWGTLADASRALADDDGLQRALGERALLIIQRAQPVGIAGDATNVDQATLAQALPLLDEQEAVCRRTGNPVGLAACVGNRAIVLRYQGDLPGALAAVEQQLQLAQTSNNAQGVLFATANRGELLGLLGRVPEAIAALGQARATAAQYNLGPMVQQLDAMLQALHTRN
jgi:ATP/maltotriose-dependent transcriptional regulator MalT